MENNFVLLRNKTVEKTEILVRFDGYLEAVETRKVLDNNYGKGIYSVLREEEAYSLYPELKRRCLWA